MKGLLQAVREGLALPPFGCDERRQSVAQFPFVPIRLVGRKNRKQQCGEEFPNESHPDIVHHEKSAPVLQRSFYFLAQAVDFQDVVEYIVCNDAVELT